MKKIHYLLILCLVFYSFPYLISSNITVSDELDYHYFSSLLKEKGRLSFEPEGDRIFGFKGFIPKHFTYNNSGKAVPCGPPGLILLAAFIKFIFPGKLFLLINPILGVLCVVLIYEVAKYVLRDEKQAFYSALLLATTPLLIHWTNMFYPTLLNLTAFLFSLWCLVQAMKSQRMIFYIGLGFSLGYLIWVRYSCIIFLMPLGMYLWLNRNRLSLKSLLPVFGIFFLLIGLLMLYHTKIYGGPFKVGHTSPPVHLVVARNLASVAKEVKQQAQKTETRTEHNVKSSGIKGDLDSAFRIVHLNTTNLTYHAKTAPLALSLAYPPFILALLGLVYGLKTREKRYFCLFTLAVLVTAFLVFSGCEKTYGYQRWHLTLQSSFLRYLLPAIGLLSVPTVTALCSLNLTVKKWVVFLIMLNLSVASFAHFGIIHSSLNKIYLKDVTRFIAENTDKRTVVLSSYWSRLIFPQRLIYRPIGLSEKELTLIIGKILQKGYRVAYVYYQWDEKVFKALTKHYRMEKVEGPQKLHPLIKMLPVHIPKHVYPVKLFKIKSDDYLQPDSKCMEPYGNFD